MALITSQKVSFWFGILLVFQHCQASADPKTHQAAITPQELLPLMAACDLLQPARMFKHPTATLSEMCSKGKQLLMLGMSSPGPQPWTWQPGKMIDHDDFKYAGNSRISSFLPESKVPGISLDSAHFYAKWPLFFLSARDSSEGEARDFFDEAIVGLIANLFDRVVEVDSGDCVVRYRNYIDGTNGVYRWNWRGKGLGYGHGAYSLSYTPFFSSTALLDDERVSRHYRTISGCYPYSDAQKKEYFWGRDLEEERLLVMLSERRPSDVARGDVPTKAELSYYDLFFSKRISAEKPISTEDAYAAVVGDRMLVMHYAFYMGYEPWLRDFYAYAEKASRSVCVRCANSLGFYQELHLIYFLGKYLSLFATYPQGVSGGHQEIFGRVAGRVEDLYLRDQPEMISIYGWDGVRIYNLKEYVDWKIAYYTSRPGRVEVFSSE